MHTPRPAARFLRTLCFAALAGAGAMAHAASLKPGLWEMTSKVASASPEAMQALSMAQQQMANLTPEQRRGMEQMLAQHGVKMQLAEGGGVKVNFCLTKEQAANPRLPAGQPGQCETTQSPVPNGMNIAFKCSKPKSSGNGQVIFQGDSGYSMRMNVDSSAAGQAQNMTVESQGRWLAADCGSTPPVQ
ncbi:uncharacterized protein DUF3617 [Pseudoduganella lurida]|uniref:Uncharacterized protein DUF3617 n=1 Tax=Pseudoduganella lurida TaxID=1036180 RepID=A0A562RM88_9BURK|nr:DUF3617 domain-containing protein [Pseudoduganella lurida]TWI70157.1 uncharacterized protein DUF3617 [Pseudoduganella lurida]